jgi:Carboxypeptidase regulatory-like domain/TonB dependent receptor/TonB-dependent Receptor Plug Domain
MFCLAGSMRSAAFATLLALLSTSRAQDLPVGASPSAPQIRSSQKLVIAVADENGVAVPSARVQLRSSPDSTPVWCATDFSGRCTISNLTAAAYRITVEKPGFYAVSNLPVNPGQASSVDVKLFHIQEVHEVVNVVESPPGIDPLQTASTEQITGLDILNIPYPSTHDYRNVLNFIPGVIQDNGGQPHIAGASTYQTLTLFDGFNITQPANGNLQLRVSTDAIRSIQVQDSRISAEHGKGSGGVLGITTGIGDDHFFFAATNFLPSAQLKRGVSFDNVVPRVTFSGPIKTGRIWFFEGVDGEFQHNIVTELPSGQDTDNFWRAGNIAKIQLNLAPAHILTASYLFNRQHEEHSGLSIFSPQPSTPSDTERGDFLTARDQIYFAGGQLLDFGFNFDQYGSDVRPQGSGAFVANARNVTGSYYFGSHIRARRWQGVSNLSLAPHQWYGRHEFKLGVDLDRIAYNPLFQRSPISYLAVGHTLAPGQTCLSVSPSPCARYSSFSIGPQSETNNVEVSGYFQDRWSPSERLIVEAGLRYDWDEIIRNSLFSPRLAGSYLLDKQGNTKLSAGIGIFHDATNMVLISQPFEGQRTDYFFNPQGQITATVPMTFSVNQDALHTPRFVNWSLGVEHNFPANVYVRADFIRRHGIRGFVYNTPPGSPLLSGDFILQNSGEQHYDGFLISARHAFRKTYLLTLSYMRSNARTNQVLTFNVDSPIYSPQLPGPLPWDSPNRFLSTGILPARIPLLKRVDLEYSAEARTGFPFFVVNKSQQLAEPPGSRRFPYFLSINLFLEKRFHWRGRYWAVRGGFIDINGRHNPAAVNNNIDSPNFLEFGAFTHRAFTARIRLLGRK